MRSFFIFGFISSELNWTLILSYYLTRNFLMEALIFKLFNFCLKKVILKKIL